MSKKNSSDALALLTPFKNGLPFYFQYAILESVMNSNENAIRKIITSKSHHTTSYIAYPAYKPLLIH